MLNIETSTGKMVSLNDSKYQVWKIKMEDILYMKDLYLPVFSLVKLEDKGENEKYVIGKCMTF